MAQARGIRIHQYLDDWLLRAPCQETCRRHTQTLLDLCHDLGWVVNLSKSELTPQQVFNFDDYRFDLSRSGQTHSGEVVSSVRENRPCFLTGDLFCQAVHVPDMAFDSHRKTSGFGMASYETHSMALKETLACPGSPGEVHSSAKISPFSPQVVVGPSVLKGQPVHLLRHTLQLFTDASNEGWGAHLGEYTAKGLWSKPEGVLHINFLELKVVLLALKQIRE